MNSTFISVVAGRIESFLGEFTGQKGVFLVDVIVRGSRSGAVLEVYIDGDVGVDAGTCAEVSRAIAKDLESGVLAGEIKYELTVSSPGLDRPLKFPRQYGKHIGRGIAVTLRTGETTELLRGILTTAGDRSIGVRADARGDSREISYDDIVEAKIESRW